MITQQLRSKKRNKIKSIITTNRKRTFSRTYRFRQLQSPRSSSRSSSRSPSLSFRHSSPRFPRRSSPRSPRSPIRSTSFQSFPSSIQRRFSSVRSLSPRKSLTPLPMQNFSKRPSSVPLRESTSRRRAERNNQKSRKLPHPCGSFPQEYEMIGVQCLPKFEISASNVSYPQILNPSYVLSIRPERFYAFVDRFGPWAQCCRRVKCVVGVDLDKTTLLRNGTVSRRARRMRLGEIGCYLSHLTAWKAIRDSPLEYGTVFEDDVDIHFSKAAQTVRTIQNAMDELVSKKIKWDVLYWCISPAPHVKKQLQPHPVLKKWSVVPTNACMACIAYTINKRTASLWCARALPIAVPVDVYVSSTFGTSVKTLCINPHLGTIIPSSSDTSHTARPYYLKYL